MRKVSRNQLEWVRRNRHPADRSEPLGAVAQRAMQAQSVTRAVDLAALLELIGRWTDDEFRTHCTLGAFSGGLLDVLVDHESLVASMRRKWTIDLMHILSTEFRGPHVANIVFSVGRSEVVFAKNQEPSTARDGADARTQEAHNR